VGYVSFISIDLYICKTYFLSRNFRLILDLFDEMSVPLIKIFYHPPFDYVVCFS